MKILICGSRGFCGESYYGMLKDYLNGLWPIDVLVSGGCKNSADELAERYALEYDIPIKIYKADWDNLGRGAGFIRNSIMAEEGPDETVAIWDGKSRGTRDMIEKAVQSGSFVSIIPAKM